jgi:RimJ/RimL family protein N-acetyltransferase
MRAWRNQQANRAVSNTQHVITPEEHRRWWDQVVADPTRQVLVLELDGRAWGVVSFFDVHLEATPRTGSWGFYLDHDGLAETGGTFVAWQRVMGEALDHAFEVLGLDVLEAEVLAHNEAVRLTNRRHGFVEDEPVFREVAGERIEVIPVRLRREDRRQRRKATS